MNIRVTEWSVSYLAPSGIWSDRPSWFFAQYDDEAQARARYERESLSLSNLKVLLTHKGRDVAKAYPQA
jgi:hypothetical protein